MEMNDFAKLLAECEVLCSMSGKDVQDKKMIFTHLEPSFKKLMQTTERVIKQANLTQPHFYRIKIIVHAQERKDESK